MKSNAKSDQLTIGQAAEHFSLDTHVLRHWETVGLLAPARSADGQRRYGILDLYRVAAILRGKEAALSLEDIRAVITDSNPATRKLTLQRHREDLAQRIAHAQASLELLETALHCRHGDIATCPRFQAFLDARVGKHPSDGSRTHERG